MIIIEDPTVTVK